LLATGIFLLVGAGFGVSMPGLVKLPFSLFLALRFLRPKRTFVSVITIISVLGVTLGITVLIVVMSVMTGFSKTLQRAILGFEPHLRVVNGDLMQNWREVLPGLGKVPGVIGAAPYVTGAVLVERTNDDSQTTRTVQAIIRGINVAQEEQLVDLKKFVTGTTEMGSDEVILGRTLARELGVDIGDEVTIYAPGNISGLMASVKKHQANPGSKAPTLEDVVIPAPMKIVGVFSSGTNTFDSTFILMPLHMAQELYGLKDTVHGIAVKTRDPYHVERTQEAIETQFGGRLNTVSWYDENRARFDAIKMEKHVMFFILMFIVVVAAFSVMNTQITVTVQKTREIGIMKALGATPAQIVWVFLAQGMFVGVLGNITGLGLGLGILHYRNPFRDWLSDRLGIVIFPPSIYEFDGIPAEVVPADVAAICISAFVICALAAYIPARIASRLDPVKALRHE
jgi:lipoprotein-releasing system permease protein